MTLFVRSKDERRMGRRIQILCLIAKLWSRGHLRRKRSSIGGKGQEGRTDRALALAWKSETPATIKLELQILRKLAPENELPTFRGALRRLRTTLASANVKKPS